MTKAQNNWTSDPVETFRGQQLPEAAVLAGYSALIATYKLEVPLPRNLAAISERHTTYIKADWQIKTPKHQPDATLEGHLTFALKYEGLDLIVLKRLFITIDPQLLVSMVKSKPTSSYIRRFWFLYEWLLDVRLDLPDALTGNYVTVLNEKQQFGVEGKNSPRHRVRNNLPGTPSFCPLIFKTDKLTTFIESNLAATANQIISKIPKDVMARTAAFLLLKDSKASFDIENEKPPQGRIQRWGTAIGQAGTKPLGQQELIRLQEIVIGDARFTKLGLRTEGGFIGEHDRQTGTPLPDHISAKHEDLADLLEGLIVFDKDAAHKMDAVLAAATLAFGFVYIHPFADGNGRIHRYLIHHVLTERGFNPVGMVFPVSGAIHERLDDYRHVLEDYSSGVLPWVKWKATASNNVEVLNDTVDLYRYFDATLAAEFLYECVETTINHDLPNEAQHLQSYDAFKTDVDNTVSMPDRMVDLLYRFLRQNDGRFSKRALTQEFSALNEGEVDILESIYERHFKKE